MKGLEGRKGREGELNNVDDYSRLLFPFLPALGTAARTHDGGTQKMRHDRVLRSEIAYM